MRGDGFEWAVHEAITGKEPRVVNPVSDAMKRASQAIKKSSKGVGSPEPTSLLFGQERAKYLGFVDAVVDQAGTDAYLLPEGSGRPFQFGPWVATAAGGHVAEPKLPARIKQIWKTDIFLGSLNNPSYLAATIKSNAALLEPGRGLRIGIVPEGGKKHAGVKYDDQKNLWVVSLADPDGFMGVFNDAYFAVARSFYHLAGRNLPVHLYAIKPSAKAIRVEEQLNKYGDALVLEVESALDQAAQQQLINVQHQLLGVNAPNWLYMKQMAPSVIAPKPRFDILD